MVIGVSSQEYGDWGHMGGNRGHSCCITSTWVEKTITVGVANNFLKKPFFMLFCVFFSIFLFFIFFTIFFSFFHASTVVAV